MPVIDIALLSNWSALSSSCDVPSHFLAPDPPLKAITISSSRWLEACWTQLRPYPETNPSRCKVVCVPEGSAGAGKGKEGLRANGTPRGGARAGGSLLSEGGGARHSEGRPCARP